MLVLGSGKDTVRCMRNRMLALICTLPHGECIGGASPAHQFAVGPAGRG